MADREALTRESARRAADVLDDRVLEALREVGGWGYTARELAERLGVCDTAARDALRRLRDRRLAHRGVAGGVGYWTATGRMAG